MIAWSTRRGTEADRPWLWALHAATIRVTAEPIWGWDDAEQRARFHATLDLGAVEILVVEGRDVGVMWVEDRGVDLFLARLEVHPAHQGRGVGTAVVRHLVDRAHASGRPLRLKVLVTNPRARALYARCGLSVVEELDHHWKMASNVPNAKEP